MFLPTNITLKLGDSGDFVTELQRRLSRVDCFNESAISGSFDGPTVNGVSQFQSLHGIRADGIAGPETLRRLNGAISGDFASTANPLSGATMAATTDPFLATAAMAAIAVDAYQHQPAPTQPEHYADPSYAPPVQQQAYTTQTQQYVSHHHQHQPQYMSPAAVEMAVQVATVPPAPQPQQYAPAPQHYAQAHAVSPEQQAAALAQQQQSQLQQQPPQQPQVPQQQVPQQQAPYQQQQTQYQQAPQYQQQPAAAAQYHQQAAAPQPQQYQQHQSQAHTAPISLAQPPMPQQHVPAAPQLAVHHQQPTAAAAHAPQEVAATQQAPVVEQQKGMLGRAVQYANDMVQKLANYFESKLPAPVINEVKSIGVAMARSGVQEVAIPNTAEPQRGVEQGRGQQQQQAHQRS
ncbi:MAG: peptidoglycan-binding domain-containing protein [Rickettsiales bacterium]